MMRRTRASRRTLRMAAVAGSVLAGIVLLAGALALPGCGSTTAGGVSDLPGARRTVPNLVFELPMSASLTPKQAYAASARVQDGSSGEEHPPLATLWVAQTRTAALAIAELAATAGEGGGPVLALVTLELLANPGLASGGTSWFSTAGNLSLHETCPGAPSGYCRVGTLTGLANTPIPWNEDWVARDGMWGFAARLSAPLDGPPQGGTLAGVRFAVAVRVTNGQPLVVVGDADQATVDALANNPPSG